MLDGWYCRSIANMQANEAAGGSGNEPAPAQHERARQQRKDYSSDSSSDADSEHQYNTEPNYRMQYLTLKKKLKNLIYENECFQDALRSSQKRLLKVSRDRNFLLDRLLKYEKADSSTSDSEETESSDDTDYHRVDAIKRKKMQACAQQQNTNVSMQQQSSTAPAKNPNPAVKRKRTVVPKKQTMVSHAANERMLQASAAAMLAKASPALGFGLSASDGHMTPEEVERHLQSRQSYLELLPERAPPTVPTEMFSNDPSLDSESNDVLENSPNVDEWFD